MGKLQKFENFLKDVQMKYTDDFSDLQEIIRLYQRLSETHRDLKKKQELSEASVDIINNELDRFTKETGTRSLEFTNLIAEEQKKLQVVEAEKTKLRIGNQDKTEQLLKKTSEHGIILMSIKSLW